MTSPAVVPMQPDEKPTEAGWYVVARQDGDREIIELYGDTDGFLVLRTGGVAWEALGKALDEGLTFIARIFPDRIGRP